MPRFSRDMANIKVLTLSNVNYFISKFKKYSGTIMIQLYDLDGKSLNANEIVSTYFEAQNEFKRKNPSFIGTKFIFAAQKVFEADIMERAFEQIQRLHEQFPTFLAGFDLVGEEDKAPTLLSFAEPILNLPNEIKLFFHAGETNWFGSVDENLVIFNKNISRFRSEFIQNYVTL